MQKFRGTSSCRVWVLAGAIALALPLGVQAQSSVSVGVRQQAFDIPAGPLARALSRFSEQSGLQVLYEPDLAQGRQVVAFRGTASVESALSRLLEGSGLVHEFVNGDTVVLKRGKAMSPQQLDSKPQAKVGGSADERITGMPAIMVKGARTLNMDIERTVDDPQPYVVFDRASIERSGAMSLNDFFMTRLPMNASGVPAMQQSGYHGNSSRVNLRGLGENQTLILIDGRRTASTLVGDRMGQVDINGIALDAIERIEILPTTASAIYGGSATGGVINIVMRRDYVGTQASITYDNSFERDSAIKRYDLSTGFTLFGGKTSVLLGGSYTEANPLLLGEREFIQRGRERVLSNNPTYQNWPPNSAGVNIRSSSGASLFLDDGTPLNSAITFAPAGYAGYLNDGGAQLLSNAGVYDIALSESSARSSYGKRVAILGGGPPVKYFSGSARHELTEKAAVFLETSHAVNDTRTGGQGVSFLSVVPENAPSNPFSEQIRVSHSSMQLRSYTETRSTADRLSGGVLLSLPGEWTSSVDYTLSKSVQSFVDATPVIGSGFSAAIADGRIDALRDLDLQGIDLSQYVVSETSYIGTAQKITTKNPALRISGPIGSLKAGRPRVSFLLEQQDTEFGQSSRYAAPQTGISGYDTASFALFPARSQKIDSAYLELRVPLLSSSNQLRWVEELELQLAGRWDKYESVNAPIVGCSPAPCSPAPFEYSYSEQREFSPLAAVRFRPTPSLTLRASYGTGFLPPDINQLASPTAIYGWNSGFSLVDPKRGNSAGGIIDRISGGNPDLQPETSTSWSAGLILTPTWIDGLRLSVDYTKIRKEDAISQLQMQEIVDNEDLFAGRVVRGDNLPGDPEGWAGPIVSIDNSYVNAARTHLETYDVQLDYTLQTEGRGTLSFLAVATWLTRFESQLFTGAPLSDLSGWFSLEDATRLPLDFRGNISVEWSIDKWMFGWATRYAGSYYVADPTSSGSERIFLAQGNGGRVPSQTYHDVFGRYTFDSTSSRESSRHSAFTDGLEVQVGIRNIFNTTPPFDISTYYYYSGLGDPRLATYYVTLRKKF